MEVKIIEQGKITILEFIGSMDATTTITYDEALENCFAKGQNKIIIDFKKLEYISSAGLRSILQIEKQRHANNAEIVFCSLQEMVEKIFQVSAFTTILQVVKNLDDAKKTLSE